MKGEKETNSKKHLNHNRCAVLCQLPIMNNNVEGKAPSDLLFRIQGLEIYFYLSVGP